MNIDFRRTSHIVFFGGFLPALSLFVSWCFFQIIPNPPFWLETVSPIYAYGIFFTFFDKYLWPIKLFKTLGIVYLPDLRGRWTGTLRSSYKTKGRNVKIPFCLEVEQSFSCIRVAAYYEKSQSESKVASFSNIDNCIYLYYTYDNEPNSLKVGGMQNHKGTAKIMYIPMENRLVGFYFNSIGNHGDLNLKFSERKLYYRFDKKS